MFTWESIAGVRAPGLARHRDISRDSRRLRLQTNRLQQVSERWRFVASGAQGERAAVYVQIKQQFYTK